MDALTFNWPWWGAGIAAVLLVLLFASRWFRTVPRGSRWLDIGWLAVLGVPIYMLHQVEEHGIDLLGVHYAFRGALCAVLGFENVAACPIPFGFITAVNVGSVWGATTLSALAGPRRPLLALSAFGIPFINALAHMGDALRHAAYNPGLLTAVVLLLPLSAWALAIGVRTGAITLKGAAAILIGGVLTHVVLIASLVAYVHGLFDDGALVAVQLINTFVPALTVVAASRSGFASLAANSDIQR